MPLNDNTGDEFSTELQDEHVFDAHPPPGIEMLGMNIQTDYGSGSYAEDGRLEVAEDETMNNGEMSESALVGSGLASEEGQSEIGVLANVSDWDKTTGFPAGSIVRYFGSYYKATQDIPSRWFFWGNDSPDESAAWVALTPQQVSAMMANSVGAAAAADRPGSEIGLGLASEEGQSEIGDWSPEDRGLNSSVLGSYAMYGPTEIGAGLASEEGQSEIGLGLASEQSEIGQYAEEGASEIGDWSPEDQGRLNSSVMGGPEVQAPFESFMLGPTGIGAAEMPAAVIKAVEKARDNRQPPPPMKAVDVDAPIADGYDSDVAEFLIGAAMTTGANEFPLTTQFMQRCGAGCPPRYVRVDTEESYQQFRANHSAEMRELSARVDDLAARLDAHLHDPHAHGLDGGADGADGADGGDGASFDYNNNEGFNDDLNADIEDLTVLGQEVDAAEAAKRIDLWMPKRYQGLITAWREGNHVCASLTLPGNDGTVKVCTSLEPVVKCVEEMSKHAAEAGSAETVIGVLPAMGCVLGAGTILKEVAAAAPAILNRPEAKGSAPFVVRIEPKLDPAISALAMLAMACKAGNKQACKEWAKLGKYSPAPVRQAMTEALALAKSV
jgi:hypothetical protein